MENIRVAIAGGGTGGHVYPALNLAAIIKENWNAEFLFFGTRRGLESTKVPAAGYPLVLLPVAGIQRRVTLSNLLVPFKLWKSMNICRQKLKEFQPHLVIGTGGYVMGPVLRTAQKMGIPTILQEQNSYPGITTRSLAGRADRVLLAYEEARSLFKRQDNLVVTGNPVVLPEVAESKQELQKAFGLQPDVLTVLIFGGSQGAASINRAMAQIVQQKDFREGVQFIWQTGQRDFERYREQAERQGWANVRLFAYIEPMARAYKAADLAVCRAGAMTLSELMAAGLPAILIPYPYAAADHQTRNAEALQDKNAALIIEDNDHLPQSLREALKTVLDNRRLIETMRQKIRELHRPQTARLIREQIQEVLKEHYAATDD